MSISRREQVPAAGPGHSSAVLVVILMLGCATIAGLSAAGQQLQHAGYGVHDLLMEEADTDEIVTYSATELQEIHRADDGA